MTGKHGVLLSGLVGLLTGLDTGTARATVSVTVQVPKGGSLPHTGSDVLSMTVLGCLLLVLGSLLLIAGRGSRT